MYSSDNDEVFVKTPWLNEALIQSNVLQGSFKVLIQGFKSIPSSDLFLEAFIFEFRSQASGFYSNKYKRLKNKLSGPTQG